jgi:hypothetical protein
VQDASSDTALINGRAQRFCTRFEFLQVVIRPAQCFRKIASAANKSDQSSKLAAFVLCMMRVQLLKRERIAQAVNQARDLFHAVRLRRSGEHHKHASLRLVIRGGATAGRPGALFLA